MPARLLFYLLGAWLLLIALIARFHSRRNPNVSKKAWLLFFALSTLFIVWGACGGFYAIFMFTNRVRAHRALDPDAVVAIEVLPGKYPAINPSLIPQPVVVRDRQRIEQVIHALKGAEPWAPAHPRTTWECILQVDDGTRKYSYRVSSTTNNVVVIDVENGGSLLGVYREDGLKEILERIAREDGKAQDG